MASTVDFGRIADESADNSGRRNKKNVILLRMGGMSLSNGRRGSLACSNAGGIEGVFRVAKMEPGSLDPFPPNLSEIAAMNDGGLIEVMAEARRAASRMQALELAAVAELARRREAEDQVSGTGMIRAYDYLHEEVASALTLTAASADVLIRFATELTGRLPATFAALAAGDLDYAKALTLWRGTAEVDGEVTSAIETRVLSRAAEQTTGQIRAKIRRLVRHLAPDALDERRRRAEERRDVQLVLTDDSTAHLSGLDLPTDAATAARNRVHAIATGLKHDGDQRGIGQLRADVFLGLLCGTLTATEAPADLTARPVPDAGRESGWTSIDDAVADVIAHVARDRLSALTDELSAPDLPVKGRRERSEGIANAADPRIDQGEATRSPRNQRLDDFTVATTRAAEDGSVPGQGLGDFIVRAARDRFASLPRPTPEHDLPDRHRALAELITQAGERITEALIPLKTDWCALPSAPPGKSGSGRARHGHQGYRTPTRMRRLIETRDRRCGFPGCRRPVRHCDADHTIPYHRGGSTCPCNIALLCRRHHSLKQTPGWRLHQLWPGVLLWVGPTGHWRISAPPDRE